MKNIWNKFKKPFFALAPMDGVTDSAFRQVVALAGKPDVFFTEFTNVDGLVSEKGFQRLSKKLEFTSSERPLVAQIWGTKPENFLLAGKIIQSLGFDGIDINMGCPDRKVLKVGGGGALIGNKSLVKEIIDAVKRGAQELPISLKTRIGIKEIQTEEWIGFLLSLNLDALTIHGRTVLEKSEVLNHWEEIGKAVKIKKENASKTLIIGNGDIKSYAEGFQKVKEYGVDGVMIGRGIFTDPWVFRENPEQRSIEEKLELLLLHLQLFENLYPGFKLDPLKKFFKIYVSGFLGAKDLRAQLMEVQNPQEVKDRVSSYQKFMVRLRDS